MTTGITFAAAIDLTSDFVQELQENQLPRRKSQYL